MPPSSGATMRLMADSPDVPSPIDLRSMADAWEWAQSAMLKRPWRTAFFTKIAEQLPSGHIRVLEIGSGPGFLAELLLQTNPDIEYIALDFSTAMHDLARERLVNAAHRVQFVEADFRQNTWVRGLASFDAVVTVQAVHELRHKRHAPALYAAVRDLLRTRGQFLMCDHFVGEDGMSDGDLFMTPEEHATALRTGGFANTAVLLKHSGLILFQAAESVIARQD